MGVRSVFTSVDMLVKRRQIEVLILLKSGPNSYIALSRCQTFLRCDRDSYLTFPLEILILSKLALGISEGVGQPL